MAISVQCACGKRTAVSDALAGKAIRCPACGSTVLVAASAPAPGRGGGKRQPPGGKRQGAGPAIELSRGQIVALCVIGGLVLIGGVFYVGPVRVWQQWGAMEPKASEDVRDLVIYSLNEHMKEENPDPRMRRRQPSAERGDLSFFTPMALTMPQKVGFFGKSSQGTFSGNYNIRTGEVDATVSYGGLTFGGMVDVSRPKGTLHVVGRVVDGKRDVEIDGKKPEINAMAQ